MSSAWDRWVDKVRTGLAQLRPGVSMKLHRRGVVSLTYHPWQGKTHRGPTTVEAGAAVHGALSGFCTIRDVGDDAWEVTPDPLKAKVLKKEEAELIDLLGLTPDWMLEDILDQMGWDL